MIPYGRQDISEDDIEAVVRTLRSAFLTQGPQVPEFEANIAQAVGVLHAVAVNNATAALHLACLALDVGPGDQVWTTPLTFVASANCALYCGASVDFVDIDPKTYNMSVECLTEKLESASRQGKLPKVVIPVHLCGQSCEMAAIKGLADKFGFRLIEDASHAIGGAYLGEPIGNCRYSDITIFSFHPVKIITTGEGGVATTNDAALADRMQRLRSHGLTNIPALMDPRPVNEIWNYQQIELGYNYRITDIQAALGTSQLKRLGEFIKARRHLASRYDQALSTLSIKLPWQHPDTASSYHLYPIRIPEGGKGPSQKDVYDTLLAEGVRSNLHYIPVYRQPYYERLGFVAGYCPQAEQYHREAITIPLFATLTETDQDRVVSIIKSLWE
jgi:UDP-4-amino-4,6-dideoxy-N-acetyl-beta-L-altrosamine transaminase